LIELVEVCVPCLGLFESLGSVGDTPTLAPLPANAAFSSPAAFQVAISSSSTGETPLLKNRTRLLRHFKKINRPPTRTTTPTTDSTALKVIARVRLLPRPVVSSPVEATCRTALVDADISEAIAAVTLPLQTEDVGLGNCMVVFAKVKNHDRGIENDSWLVGQYPYCGYVWDPQ
jgi:hypothetical protein